MLLVKMTNTTDKYNMVLVKQCVAPLSHQLHCSVNISKSSLIGKLDQFRLHRAMRSKRNDLTIIKFVKKQHFAPLFTCAGEGPSWMCP